MNISPIHHSDNTTIELTGMKRNNQPTNTESHSVFSYLLLNTSSPPHPALLSPLLQWCKSLRCCCSSLWHTEQTSLPRISAAKLIHPLPERPHKNAPTPHQAAPGNAPHRGNLLSLVSHAPPVLAGLLQYLKSAEQFLTRVNRSFMHLYTITIGESALVLSQLGKELFKKI